MCYTRFNNSSTEIFFFNTVKKFIQYIIGCLIKVRILEIKQEIIFNNTLYKGFSLVYI